MFASESQKFNFNKVELNSGEQPSGEVALIDNSAAINTNSWTSNSSVAAYKLVSSLPSVQEVSLSDLAIFGIPSSKSEIRDAFWAPREGGEHGILDPARRHYRAPHSRAELVPEPPSLSLLLTGLMAIGIVSLRRSRLA